MSARHLLSLAPLFAAMLSACYLGPQFVEIPVTVVVTSPPVVRVVTATPASPLVMAAPVSIAVYPVPVVPAPFQTNLSKDWTDPMGDTSSLNADIISGSATVLNGDTEKWVDFRLQFSASPFATGNNYLGWCMDTDQNGTTNNACGLGSFGDDPWIVLWGTFDEASGAELHFRGNLENLNPCFYVSFDPVTSTVRLLFPLNLISDDGLFNYALVGIFADGLDNLPDRAPRWANFSSPEDFFTSEMIDTPLPFNGSPFTPCHADFFPT